MFKNTLWVSMAILTLLLLSACSSKPQYLSKKPQSSNITKLDLAMYESMVIYPEIEKSSKGEFQYDLSVLDKSNNIVAVILDLPIASKEIFARSLGGANAKDLAAIIRPTPYLGSRVKTSKADYVQAYDSNLEYETPALSILQRAGGTGGKTVYSSVGPGIDKYDLTEMLKAYFSLGKPLTFSLTMSAAGLSDSTIFSTSYKIAKLELGRIGENNNASRITIYYE